IVKIWDLSSHELKFELQVQGAARAGFLEKSDEMFVLSTEGFLAFYNYKSKKETERIKFRLPVEDVRVSSGEQIFATHTILGSLFICQRGKDEIREIRNIAKKCEFGISESRLYVLQEKLLTGYETSTAKKILDKEIDLRAIEFAQFSAGQAVIFSAAKNSLTL